MVKQMFDDSTKKSPAVHQMLHSVKSHVICHLIICSIVIYVTCSFIGTWGVEKSAVRPYLRDGRLQFHWLTFLAFETLHMIVKGILCCIVGQLLSWCLLENIKRTRGWPLVNSFLLITFIEEIKERMYVSDVWPSLCNMRSRCNLEKFKKKGHLPHYHKKAPFELISVRFEKKKIAFHA